MEWYQHLIIYLFAIGFFFGMWLLGDH